MLDSVKITRRQSEIRQALAGLVGKEKPTEDEVRNIEAMDLEFRSNETRYRAALICEDTERRDAGAELETRSGKEWAAMMQGFELRQVALNLDEGRQLDGKTAEIVQELRSAGGFRGIPVPWQALEQRAGETVSGGVPDPVQHRPIIDRLFPDSVASRMGAQTISIAQGSVAWPVTTSSVSAGWATTETGNVAGPTAYATTDKAMSPDHNLGVQMRITRKALQQSGAALEQAIRRDMSGAMGVAMDKAVFLGTGADGQPLGVITGAATYGITATAVDASANWAAFRAVGVAMDVVGDLCDLNHNEGLGMDYSYLMEFIGTHIVAVTRERMENGWDAPPATPEAFRAFARYADFLLESREDDMARGLVTALDEMEKAARHAATMYEMVGHPLD